jgi:mannitol/fructose-specific phosphotransferase system IIA component (Ntr-type)
MLGKYLKLECCNVNFEASDKNEALENIVKLLKQNETLNNVDETAILNALIEREKQGTTGFGDGIAIPHCQLDEIKDFVIAIAVSKNGINFKSIDKKKSYVFVAIIGPKNKQPEYLRLLAQVSRELKDKKVFDSILESQTKISLYEEFLRNSIINVSEEIYKKADKLMIIVVKDEYILTDITEIFIEFGIEYGLIIESKIMKNLMSKVPLFLGFFDFTGDKNYFNKIILTRINENIEKAVIKQIENCFGDLNNYSGISVMSIKLDFYKGNF